GFVGHGKRKSIAEINGGDCSRLCVANGRCKQQDQPCESSEYTRHGASPSRQSADGRAALLCSIGVRARWRVLQSIFGKLLSWGSYLMPVRPVLAAPNRAAIGG